MLEKITIQFCSKMDIKTSKYIYNYQLQLFHAIASSSLFSDIKPSYDAYHLLMTIVEATNRVPTHYCQWVLQRPPSHDIRCEVAEVQYENLSWNQNLPNFVCTEHPLLSTNHCPILHGGLTAMNFTKIHNEMSTRKQVRDKWGFVRFQLNVVLALTVLIITDLRDPITNKD